MLLRRRASRICAAGACAVTLACWAAACSGPSDPAAPRPGARLPGGDGGLFDAGGNDGPPGLDAQGLCGNQIHESVIDAPNLYFVLDNSGSMAAPSSFGTRYDAVRQASIDLLRKLGVLVNVGAAIFPKESETDDCRTGGPVMAVLPGTPPDPVTGKDGSTTKFFASATNSDPFGGTPTAATLEVLKPTLVALPGRTVVLLATDGGPNCNADASCDASGCMTNIEGDCPPEAGNCCAPSGPAGPAMCVDGDETVSAIAALATADIPCLLYTSPSPRDS